MKDPHKLTAAFHTLSSGLGGCPRAVWGSDAIVEAVRGSKSAPSTVRVVPAVVIRAELGKIWHEKS